MEPANLKQWPLKSFSGRLYSCARPGRSAGKKNPVPDELLHEWVKGLPRGVAAIISLLGKKHSGKNEWSYYSFYGNQSFEGWLNEHHGQLGIQVIEHPTVDGDPIPDAVLAGALSDIARLLLEGLLWW